MGRPEEVFQDVVGRGVGVFKGLIGTVSEALRVGEQGIKDLDGALRGEPPTPGETPDQTFLNVLSLVQAAIEEAKESGSPTTPAVVQRSRQILSRVTSAEPAWRSGPAVVKTATDMFRVALRDLRGSESLIKMASGQGGLDDLEKLTDWADNVAQRLDQTQKVIAQPKEAPGPEVSPVTPPAAKKKRKTTPKAKPDPADVAFAQAVAEELGDTKVQGWAQDFAAGKISEKQWISRLTTHAAATHDTLDNVFSRAEERIKGSNGKS